MEQVLAVRPFVPAKDFEVSKRFYQALGFRISLENAEIAAMKLGGFGFILQNYYVEEWAGNFMMQLMVRDLDAWWRDTDPDKLAADFGTRPARAPAMQPWGLRVGYIVDPSGVLWHVAEAAF
ncbi:VOC family protein [Phenylobacterium montanum]|uniref:Glyoxalase/fosfomycin resistance/dioxygenase domain-containing protein n=1 Tax=Phenylobacterium montanum TaxID=2823693 RepID=A0A975IUW9_9CAUL|nr:VOC family protein [Caulobacter sp. S6]QUD88233.1 hypothetical protein KCG34_24925 [Caulobacter sp. S6]